MSSQAVASQPVLSTLLKLIVHAQIEVYSRASQCSVRGALDLITHLIIIIRKDMFVKKKPRKMPVVDRFVEQVFSSDWPRMFA